jgi:head-tail adaptor
MTAGKRNRVIFIDRETSTPNAAGYPVSAWSIIGTVRAEVVQNIADEAATDLGQARTDSIVFRTVYLGGLKTADRIRFLGRTYNVKSFTEIGVRAGLEIKAEAIE